MPAAKLQLLLPFLTGGSCVHESISVGRGREGGREGANTSKVHLPASPLPALSPLLSAFSSRQTAWSGLVHTMGNVIHPKQAGEDPQRPRAIQ